MMFKKIFLYETDNWQLQLFRYVFVGGFAFVVDYGLLFVLTEFVHTNYLLSAAFAFVSGLIVNYVLSTTWVFNQHNSSSRYKEFFVFSIIGVIGLLLNEAIMYVGTDMMGFHYMVSKLASTAMVFFWNFFVRKIILFSK